MTLNSKVPFKEIENDKDTIEKNNKKKIIKTLLNINRGTIYMCEFGDNAGHIQGGFRPGLVISNQVNNRFSPVVLVVPISTRKQKHNLPTHVEIDKFDFETGGIKKKSIIQCEQIQTINKSDIHTKIGKINNTKIKQIEQALLLQLSIAVSCTRG